MDRREFLGASMTAAALSFATPRILHAADAPKVRLGLIGCGGRGSWIIQLFAAHGGYEIVSAADYFKDRVDNVGDKFNLPAERRHTGLDAYKKLLDDKVDAIAVISPPYFHPTHAAAGIEAGVHVYLAKPIAVDVPGCKRVETLGKTATDKQKVFLVDFQTRVDPFYMECLKRLRAGAIGDLAFGEASYHGGRLNPQTKPDDSPEARLRNWVFDKKLSGDIITEQFIHALDVMSWIMDKPPVSATMTCGRVVRTDVGDASDNFAGVYRYPDDIGVTFSGRQFDAAGTKPDGIRNRMFGSQGVLETAYGGETLIRGKNFYRGGASPGIYKDGAVSNIAEFHRRITSGQYDNPTIAPSVRSNLITILGRTAAYERRTITWDDLLKMDEPILADLSGLKS